MTAPVERSPAPKVNIGTLERAVSIAGGAALVVIGLRRRSRASLSLAAAGAEDRDGLQPATADALGYRPPEATHPLG